MRRFASQNGLTLLSLATALVHSFLHFALNVPKISGGCILANRDSATFNQRVGLFMVTLPIVTDHPEEGDIRAFASKIQDAMLEATNHPNLSLPDVMAQLAAENIPVNRQSFEVLVSQHETWAALDLDGLTVTPLAAPCQTAKVPLAVRLMDAGDSGVSLLLEGSPMVFSVQEFEKLSGELTGFVGAVVHDGFSFRLVSRGDLAHELSSVARENTGSRILI